MSMKSTGYMAHRTTGGNGVRRMDRHISTTLDERDDEFLIARLDGHDTNYTRQLGRQNQPTPTTRPEGEWTELCNGYTLT